MCGLEDGEPGSLKDCLCVPKGPTDISSVPCQLGDSLPGARSPVPGGTVPGQQLRENPLGPLPQPAQPSDTASSNAPSAQ